MTTDLEDSRIGAVPIRIVANSGGELRARRRTPGGLTTAQERLAKALMRAGLAERITLPAVAAACGLRTSRFAHGFRRSVGVAPYAWVLQERVRRAQHLIRDGRNSLADIAQLAGFTDQSHLTRTFARHVGVTPGAWRAKA